MKKNIKKKKNKPYYKYVMPDFFIECFEVMFIVIGLMIIVLVCLVGIGISYNLYQLFIPS